LVSGNVITCNGSDFSVDPACMGLHMLLSSLLCCLLIIAVQQRRLGRELSMWWIVVVCLSAIALNIVLNLVRILILVQFGIMPGTVMHELVGIFCLVLYVIMPALIGLRWLVSRAGKAPAASGPNTALSRNGRYGMHLAVAFLISGGIFAAGRKPAPNAVLPAVPGYTASHHDSNGIVKMVHSSALVYLKALPGFYCSEHHPMLCWTGGGYLFKQVEERTIAGVPVISGTLQKGQERLYTAWWYSNGNERTASGLSWRWDALRKGGQYTIVNVTAADETTLAQQIAALAGSRSLNSWIAGESR
jgi:exosortase N